MKNTLLALSLFSFVACSKKDVSNLKSSDGSESIVTKIHKLQSLQKFTELSKEDQAQFLRYMDTCSTEAKAGIQSKISSLYAKKSVSNTNARLDSDYDIGAVEAIFDFWDYLDGDFSGLNLQYYWTVAVVDNDNPYSVQSREYLAIRTQTVEPYFYILETSHIGSTLLGLFYQYHETSNSHSLYDYAAVYTCTGLVQHEFNGYRQRIANVRLINFLNFINSAGTEY